jgi:2-polyprenyl-3-methyl-5-hydroxy-6-metoxy-1,4-benzoquinol methylase
MTVDLTKRDEALRELMDDPNCDRQLLEATYRQFQTVNGLISGWRRLYRERIRPILREADGTLVTLLDIGSGGGDVPIKLARWARDDGFNLHVTAIDPDERAWLFAVSLPDQRGVVFERRTSTSVLAAGQRFDIVTSNHLLHHLDGDDLTLLLAESELLANKLVIHNDIRRHRVAFGVYAAATWPLRNQSFLHTDGLLSIRRSYRHGELAAKAVPPWRVDSQFPYRLILTMASPTKEPT